MSQPLSPAHALLSIALKTQPVPEALRAAEAWISLNLMQPGRHADGETDVTLFLKHLPPMVDLQMGKEDHSAWIVTQLAQLVPHVSLFDPNADGVTGWDLLQARESLTLTRWWLALPDRPALGDLMQRTPPEAVPAARGMKVPTVWAAWALQDRGNELITVKEAEASLNWPTDVLGWAHPQLVKDLLEWGATWNPEVKNLWGARQRQGQLARTDVTHMQRRCAVTLDQDLSQIQSAAWRNGADVVRSLKNTKDGENWLHLLADAGDLSSFTAPYKVVTPEGTRSMDVPLFVRLLAMGVSHELTQEKIPAFLRFMTQALPTLAADPQSRAPGLTHSLGTLAHTVALHQSEVYDQLERSKQVAAQKALRPWQHTLNAWAGPIDWPAVVACADDLDSHGPGLLFCHVGAQHSFQRSLNAHGLREAAQELKQLSHPSPEKVHIRGDQPHLHWTHWAINRFQQPGKNRGVLVTPTSHKGFDILVDPQTIGYSHNHIERLLQVMTAEQKLIMLTAFFLGKPDENAFDGSKRLKGALWAQMGWERADATTRRTLEPWLERLAQGEGRGWTEVEERASKTLSIWTAETRQSQAHEVTPKERRHLRWRS